MASPDQAADSSDLCTSCGLCCRGVLFTSVRLFGDEEVEWARCSGLTVEHAGDEPRFPEPCQHLEQKRCSVYPDRPQACRTYRCHLLKRYETGEVDLQSALELVEEAERRVEKVVGIDGDATTFLDLRLRWRQGAERFIAGAKDEEQGARTFLEMTTTMLFLDREFRNRKDRSLVEEHSALEKDSMGG